MNRSLLCLALVVLYAAVAFGWRTAVQIRRHGDTGWRLTSPSGGLARATHAVFVTASALLGAAPIAALAAGHADRPWGVAALARSGAGTVAGTVGLLLLVTGCVVTVVAQLQMGASWRIGVDPAERTALITGGLYRWVRNPIFSGMGTVAVGVALMVPSVLGLLALVLSIVGIELQVRGVEEPYLHTAHGATYERWGTSAGRFLPALGRFHRVGTDHDPVLA